MTRPKELVPLSPIKGEQTFSTLLKEAQMKFSGLAKAVTIMDWYGDIFTPKNIALIKKKILATIHAPSAYVPGPEDLPAIIAALATDVQKLLS